MPRQVWVRSFVPKLKNWASFAISSAMTEHGIELVEVMDALGNLVGGQAELFGQEILRAMIVREKLVQRWVEETDGGGQALQFLEHPGEVFALVGEEFGERLLAVFGL